MNEGVLAGKDSKGSEGCPPKGHLVTWATGQHKDWARIGSTQGLWCSGHHSRLAGDLDKKPSSLERERQRERERDSSSQGKARKWDSGSTRARLILKASWWWMARDCKGSLWPVLGTGGETELRIKSLQDLEGFSGYFPVSLQAVWLLLSFFRVAFCQKPPNSTYKRFVEAHRDGVAPASLAGGAQVARKERDSVSSRQRG